MRTEVLPDLPLADALRVEEALHHVSRVVYTKEESATGGRSQLQ
jgi:hypothetical protein